MNEQLLTVAQAAERLNLSVQTVYELVKTRELAGFKLRRCVRVLASAVDDLLSGQAPPAPVSPPNHNRKR